MDKWAVVQFEDELESISTVPYSWLVIKEDTTILCHWPDTRARKYITICSEPSQSWKLYKVIAILKEFDNYEEALAFEKSKEIISSSSDNEVRLNRFGRKPIKKHLNDEFCYSSTSRQIDSPPKLNEIDDDEEERGIACDTDSLDEDQTLMPPPITDHILKKSTLNSSNKEVTLTIGKTILEENNRPHEQMDSSDKIENTNSEVCCKHADILNIIFENSVAIKTMLKEQQNTMENICQSNNEHHQQSIIDKFDSVPKKPFKKFDKLLAYDNDIRKSEESKRQLETLFYMCGGKYCKESIRRGLAKIMSDNLARKCSLTGRKGNHPLKNLMVLSLLKDATRKRYGNVSEKEFEIHISSWLRQSQLRYDRQITKNKQEVTHIEENN